MKTLKIPRPQGFQLKAASDFYSGFTPGTGMAAASVDHLTLVFRLDKTFEAIAVALHEEGPSLVCQIVGTDDVKAVQRQVSRMLGLDVDAAAWVGLGKKDSVVAKLQEEFPGFFTAAKSSPYDAAAWGVIAPRMNMKQAAKLKMGLAEKHGDAVTILGGTHHVFPSPEQLLKVKSFPGLPDEKLERLKGIAVAAMQGKLDADRLRGMKEEDALEELLTLRGVGPWTASHVLYRGAALVDALPTTEPRVLDGFAAAYGLKSPSAEKFEEVAETWRPFRMWVCILLMRHLGKTSGWSRPGLGKDRAAAGRKLTRRKAAAK